MIENQCDKGDCFLRIKDPRSENGMVGENVAPCYTTYRMAPDKIKMKGSASTLRMIYGGLGCGQGGHHAFIEHTTGQMSAAMKQYLTAHPEFDFRYVETLTELEERIDKARTIESAIRDNLSKQLASPTPDFPTHRTRP